jgi:hypothetical protein
VQSEGATLSRYITQAAAIRNGIDRAHNHQGDAEVVVRRPDGQWRIEWTYGHDPYPPPG